MNINQSISLFLVVLAALSAPVLARFLRIPVVTAEILTGILLGHTLLNIVSHSAFMHFLAEFGFLLLMFYVGLEIETKEMNLKLILLNIAAFAVNAACSFTIVKILHIDLIWIALFVATSVGVVIGVLKELKILNSRIGKITLYSGIMQEFIILIIATSYEIFRSENYSLTKYLLILLSMAMAVVFFKVVKLLHWWFPEYFNYFASSSDPLSLRIRFALAIMLLSVSFAFYFHIDPVVGAFVAGFTLSTSFSNIKTIKKDIGTIGLGFFIPLFFVYTGINIKIELQDIPFVSLIVALMFFSHIGSTIIFYFSRFSILQSLVLSLNLSKGISMVVLIMTMARAEHLITQKIFSVAVLTGIAAEIFYTVIFKSIYKNILPKIEESEAKKEPYA